jgi:hypothetical protein
MRTDFSIETREKSYIKYQSERKSIESLIEEVLDKFDLEDNNLVIPTRKFLPIRKVGLKVSNLIAIEKSNKDNEYKQKTLLDYC